MNRVYRKLRKADIMVIQNKKFDLISSGIRWFQNGKSSHTCLISDVKGQKQIEYTIGGCQERDIKIYMNYPHKVWIMRKIDLSYRERNEIVKQAKLDIGKRYDYLSYIIYILVMGLKKIGINLERKFNNFIQARDKEVCSSGVDKWYRKAGQDLFPNIGDNMVVPDDFLKHKKLTNIFILDFEEDYFRIYDKIESRIITKIYE